MAIGHMVYRVWNTEVSAAGPGHHRYTQMIHPRETAHTPGPACGPGCEQLAVGGADQEASARRPQIVITFVVDMYAPCANKVHHL
ncbi:hypothetical protein GCM10010094_04400 [Streptomyces flaveus]|uniref:Uncharacterized protein n=1 Tax=Streptomyces flaveus TaxID=66370 RepID=A0A917QF06_9ACTN|nr:hypothetical protein GCM10010094_04400 [Streptomyces flaveus]